MLTEREVGVLKLMAKGFSNKDIAAALHISSRTVQGHMSQILHKLGVSSRTKALAMALKEGWVTLDDIDQQRAPMIPALQMQ
ncbi:response regulator transcription factor [Chloroflexota bacterium]